MLKTEKKCYETDLKAFFNVRIYLSFYFSFNLVKKAPTQRLPKYFTLLLWCKIETTKPTHPC